MELKKITILTSLALLASSQAYSHGYVSSPSSRGHFCSKGDNNNCGSVQYEPQSIEAADGLFESGRIDGKIGNAGLNKWHNLNEQSESRWTKTYIRSGMPLDITWYFTANHSSRSFEFYITKPSWDSNTAPKYSDFEKLNCYNPQPYWQAPDRPPQNLTYTCTIPGGRTGHALIASVWDVADTAASFYNLVDVYFTDDPNLAGKVRSTSEDSNGGIPDSDAIPAWNADATYAESGNEVHYEGKIYRNKWWTKGNTPGSNSVWEYVSEYEDNAGGSDDTPTNPTDRHPELMTTYNVGEADIKAGDKISLQVSDSATSQLREFDLYTVPNNFTYGNLLKTLAEKINEVSKQELNDSIIAGFKDDSGVVNPSTSELKIYQTADKYHNAISIIHPISDTAPTPTPTPTPGKMVNVTLTSSTPFWQVEANGDYIQRAWYKSVGDVDLSKNPITVTSQFNRGAKVVCPLPSADASKVTYFIDGNHNSVTCKIKKSDPRKFWVW